MFLPGALVFGILGLIFDEHKSRAAIAAIIGAAGCAGLLAGI